MDSSDEDTFYTAPSQPPTPRELDSCTALEIMASLGKTLNETEVVGAETQPANSQCSVTQVEPRVTATLVQPHLAAAAEDLSKAKTQPQEAEKVLKVRKKLLQAKEALEEKGAPKVSTAVMKQPLKTKSEYHVTKSEIEQLATALNRVSLERSDTRLAITYPRDRSQYLRGGAVVKFEPTIEGNAVFGILQREKDVDFCLDIPHCEPSQICITYDPMSDDCSLTLNIDVNRGANNRTNRLFIINLDVAKKQLESSNTLRPCDWKKLKRLKIYTMQPGVWRILVRSAKEESSTIDILVHKRTFNVFISGSINSTLTKRAATEYIPNIRSSKRLKTGATYAAVGNRTTDEHNIIQTPQNPTTTLSDLPDGRWASIRSQGQLICRIERIKGIFRDSWSSMFSCRVSTISSKTVVVAKVLCCSRYGIHAAKVWRREKKALEMLNHKNIVKLEAFDGRTLTIFLELLPQSLDVLLHDESHQLNRTSFQQPEALTILRDLSSALSYLSTKNIAHNDVRPGNIAYSPRRGAVLLNFGMAHSPTSVVRSGFPWYLPPEYLRGDYRGFERDIWSLGITMIYVIGLISRPEHTPSWEIHNVFTKGSPDQKTMLHWLAYIERKRVKLSGYAAIAEFELLISDMLHSLPSVRVKAAELQRRAASIVLNNERM